MSCKCWTLWLDCLGTWDSSQISVDATLDLTDHNKYFDVVWLYGLRQGAVLTLGLFYLHRDITKLWVVDISPVPANTAFLYWHPEYTHWTMLGQMRTDVIYRVYSTKCLSEMLISDSKGVLLLYWTLSLKIHNHQQRGQELLFLPGAYTKSVWLKQKMPGHLKLLAKIPPHQPVNGILDPWIMQGFSCCDRSI